MSFSRPNSDLVIEPPSPAGGSYKIIIRDLEIAARVGVFEREKRIPQPIRINIEIIAFRSNEGLGVVDYSAVVESVSHMATRHHIMLVEDLADQIADDCLADDRVVEVTVRVEKLTAVPGTRAVGVEISRYSSR